MLNINRLHFLAKPFKGKLKYYFAHTELSIQDIRADYLLVVQDKKA